MSLDPRNPEHLRALNSATKYPSIPTYHKMGEKGRLQEALEVSFEGETSLCATEKIDGSNSRIIVLPGLFPALIGSREELLTAMGDLVYNPAQGIVEAVRDIAGRIRQAVRPEFRNIVSVLYLETYGGKTTGGAKNYRGPHESLVGARLFDVIEMDYEQFEDLCMQPPSEIAVWRERGGQPFVHQGLLNRIAHETGIEQVPAIPAVAPLPAELRGAHDWLKHHAGGYTRAALRGDVLKGKPEGIVVRTGDRKKIAKLRFEDYERTLR